MEFVIPRNDSEAIFCDERIYRYFLWRTFEGDMLARSASETNYINQNSPGGAKAPDFTRCCIC